MKKKSPLNITYIDIKMSQFICCPKELDIEETNSIILEPQFPIPTGFDKAKKHETSRYNNNISYRLSEWWWYIFTII